MKKWQLWTTTGVLGVGVLYLGYQAFKFATQNRTLTNKNNSLEQQKETALQQAQTERQQRNGAIQKVNELETKVAQLTESKKLPPTA